MPERPDLEYVVPLLQEALAGRTIGEVTVRHPVVLRVLIEGGLPDLLPGQRIEGVSRRGHFVVFDLRGLQLVVHPMLAGRFQLVPASTRVRADVCVRFHIGDGQELRYRDDKRMGKVYLLPTGQLDQVPGLAKIGVDVLDSAAFTVQVLTKLAKKQRRQVKLWLLDKATFDSFGNAYADETLFAAGLHPKTRVNELDAEDLERLHTAMVAVLSEARRVVAEREPALDEKVRDFLRVRNRKGEPCVVCETPIRAAGVRGHDAFFCPTCQPEKRARGFVDWSKLRDR